MATTQHSGIYKNRCRICGELVPRDKFAIHLETEHGIARGSW